MDNFLKTSLNLRNVQATNQFGGGCINQGQTFIVDDNKKIYVKQNSNIVSFFFVKSKNEKFSIACLVLI